MSLERFEELRHRASKTSHQPHVSQMLMCAQITWDCVESEVLIQGPKLTPATSSQAMPDGPHFASEALDKSCLFLIIHNTSISNQVSIELEL